MRMRERIINSSLDGLAPHEIIESLLFYALPRVNTNEIAHDLINAFGSISGVFDASYEDLLKVKGIGANAATLIKMVPIMCRAYIGDKYSDGEILGSTELSGQYLQRKYIGILEETPSIVLMDNKCRVINWCIIGHGSMAAADINVRKVIEFAVRCNATCTILCHNHPSGVALPSRQDIETTRVIINALKTIHVAVVDHIILGGNDFVSLADSAEYAYLFFD
ncbi:MAG: hypothetical protein BGN88_00290 [Clostridiales bacterium 43-6]|nr:MAG: hypothetical protein BGN88_00290 [Clostridiales bacterium 43-6]